jgi:hypothetical protein
MISELKLALISLSMMFLVACTGAPIQNTAVGKSEAANIIIIADDLLGASVVVGSTSFQVDKEDLTDYEMGVFGAADKAIENMDVLQLPVSSGDVNLTIKKGGVVLFDKTIYINRGQTREITL